MTTLFPDFMDTASLAHIAKGDVDALQASVTALEAQIDALQGASATPLASTPAPATAPRLDSVA